MSKGRSEDAADTLRQQMPKTIDPRAGSWLRHRPGHEAAVIDWLLLRGDQTVEGIAEEATRLLKKSPDPVTPKRVSSHISHLQRPVQIRPEDLLGHNVKVYSLAGGVRALRLPSEPNPEPTVSSAAALPEIDPETEFEIVRRRKRQADVVMAAKAARGFVCQICNKSIDIPGRAAYCEVHHIKPLGEPHFGEDELGNVIVVCPNDHVRLQYGLIELNGDVLRPVEGHAIDPAMIKWHNDNLFIGPQYKSGHERFL